MKINVVVKISGYIKIWVRYPVPTISYSTQSYPGPVFHKFLTPGPNPHPK